MLKALVEGRAALMTMALNAAAPHGSVQDIEGCGRAWRQVFTISRTILCSFPAVTTIKLRRSFSARRANRRSALPRLSNAVLAAVFQDKADEVAEAIEHHLADFAGELLQVLLARRADWMITAKRGRDGVGIATQAVHASGDLGDVA